MADHVLVLKANGEVWAWGSNWGDLQKGCLGDQSDADGRSSPVLVVGQHSFVEISRGYCASAGRKLDGSVWMWGDNDLGKCGNLSTTPSSSPVLVVGDHSFVQVALGDYHSLARKANGEIWAWGAGNNVNYVVTGMLGDNTTTNRSSPVLVAGGHSFVSVAAGPASSYGLKADGSVWAWGSGTSGQLGQGTTSTDQSSPVLVIGSHSFTGCIAGRGSPDYNVYATKSDGSVWAWGCYFRGDGTSTYVSSPVITVVGHSFIALCPGIGLKDDGSVWTWGSNAAGQLGNNTRIDALTPVLVVGNHSFCEIGMADRTRYARKVNGEVWTCGANTIGQLGTNNLVSYSSPVLVVGNHSFESLGGTLWLDDLTLGLGPSATGALTWGQEEAPDRLPWSEFGPLTPVPAAITVTATPDAQSGYYSTRTFSGVSIGAEAPDRVVVVTIACKTRELSTGVDAVTIGGINANVVAKSSSVNSQTAIAWLVVPTGTTTEIVITLSASDSEGTAIQVFRLVGATVAPVETSIDATGDYYNPKQLDATVTIPVRGIGLVAYYGQSGDLVWGPTGTDEVADVYQDPPWELRLVTAVSTTAGVWNPTVAQEGWGAMSAAVWAEGDANWGQLVVGPEGRSGPVVDTGTEEAKLITLSQTVEGTDTLWVRGNLAAFAATDADPAWEVYAGAVTRSWRYVQVKITV